MAKKRQLEFFLLRYVPDAVKEEFVNFGLAMIETPGTEGGFAEVRFARDWRRLLCLDPQADLEVLQAVANDILKRVVEVRNCEEVMKGLNDSFSNVIQVSEVRGCLTDDPVKEIEELARYYLESARLVRGRELSGRERLVLAMQEQWEAAGISGFVRPFPVAPYTGMGDSFTFDFGYLAGNQARLFHAVSLKARVDAAVMLAARYPKIAQAIRDSKSNPLIPSLTAVVDDDLELEKAEIGFALGMMREVGIRVAPVWEMAAIAETARMELGV